MEVRPAPLDHPAVVALVELHQREAHANSPPGSAFALDPSALADPAITLFGAWDGDALLGIGALRELAPEQGELKSMRTASTARRRGVARTMLEHLIAEARRRGYARINLETGTNEPFAPARALYEGHGFVPSDPFGDYALTEFNRCYELRL